MSPKNVATNNFLITLNVRLCSGNKKHLEQERMEISKVINYFSSKEMFETFKLKLKIKYSIQKLMMKYKFYIYNEVRIFFF